MIPIIKYTDVDDAMDRANSTEYGLGGSVWTNDLVEGEKRIGELQSGNTWLNAHLVDVMAPHAPFGGIRTSGTGKEGGGKIGIKEFVDQKTVRIAKKPASS